MKFLHISDLHLGKSIYGQSMLAGGDQPYWCQSFLSLCDEIKPDAVVIAGDVYDRAAPSGEAVKLLDSFLTALAERKIPVMMIAGNHDAGERVSYGRAFLAHAGIHTAGTVQKEIEHVTLQDEYGPVTFWLMPYIFPAAVSQLLEDSEIHDTDTAVRRLLACQSIDTSQRNVLVAHQAVTSAGVEEVRGGSETAVGGVGEVTADAFQDFDYTALGHIHAAYPVGSHHIRYCGSPLCYHFDETRQKEKGPLLVELGPKGSEPAVTLAKIEPLHRMRIVEDTYQNILDEERRNGKKKEYIAVTVTDRYITDTVSSSLHELFQEKGSLIFSMSSSYRTASSAASALSQVGAESPSELFLSFYHERNDGKDPDEKTLALMKYAEELCADEEEEKAVDKLVNYLMKGDRS